MLFTLSFMSAAPVWVEAFIMEKYQNILDEIQMRMALRIISDYRTYGTRAAVSSGWSSSSRTFCGGEDQNKRGEGIGRMSERLYQWTVDNGAGNWTRRLIPYPEGISTTYFQFYNIFFIN